MRDLLSFVGEEVEITIYRKGKYHNYAGRLTILSGNFVCLEVNNRRKWIPKPKYFHDTIKKIKDIKEVDK